MSQVASEHHLFLRIALHFEDGIVHCSIIMTLFMIQLLFYMATNLPVKLSGMTTFATFCFISMVPILGDNDQKKFLRPKSTTCRLWIWKAETYCYKMRGECYIMKHLYITSRHCAHLSTVTKESSG